MPPTKKVNWLQLASFVVILLLTGEVIMLILQNRELKSSLNAPAAQFEPLKLGEKIEPVRVQTLDGVTADFPYYSVHTGITGKNPNLWLLFVFSTTCPHCEETLPVWNRITTDTANRSAGTFIVGLSINSVKDTYQYVQDNKPAFYSVSVAGDTSFARKYKVAGVPETILLKGDGTVIKTWLGKLQPAQVDEIQKQLAAS